MFKLFRASRPGNVFNRNARPFSTLPFNRQNLFMNAFRNPLRVAGTRPMLDVLLMDEFQNLLSATPGSSVPEKKAKQAELKKILHELDQGDYYRTHNSLSGSQKDEKTKTFMPGIYIHVSQLNEIQAINTPVDGEYHLWVTDATNGKGAYAFSTTRLTDISNIRKILTVTDKEGSIAFISEIRPELLVHNAEAKFNNPPSQQGYNSMNFEQEYVVITPIAINLFKDKLEIINPTMFAFLVGLAIERYQLCRLAVESIASVFGAVQPDEDLSKYSMSKIVELIYNNKNTGLSKTQISMRIDNFKQTMSEFKDVYKAILDVVEKHPELKEALKDLGLLEAVKSLPMIAIEGIDTQPSPQPK